MQPGCRACLQAHAAQLDVPARLRIVTGYVEHDPFQRGRSDGILVPRVGCNVLASPSAVAGRWPHGMRTKATRAFEASPPPSNATTRVFAMRPEELLAERGALVVKIDTEGFETQVLEALRRYWPRFFAVIFEVQPNAWKHAGVSPAAGLRTIRQLMEQEGFQAAALPHRNPRNATPAGPAVFDPSAQQWMNAAAFEVRLQRMLDFPGRGGWWSEFALFKTPNARS